MPGKKYLLRDATMACCIAELSAVCTGEDFDCRLTADRCQRRGREHLTVIQIHAHFRRKA